MRPFGAIADTFLWNNSVVAILDRINTRRPHTAASGTTSHDQSIDPHAMKRSVKMCPKETGRIFFHDQNIILRLAEPRIDLYPFGVELQQRTRWHLLYPDAGVFEVL